MVHNGITVRRGVVGDARGMAHIFNASFRESTLEILPGGVPDGVIADLMAFLLWADPRACLVATLDGSLVGYCIAPASMLRIWLRAPLTIRMWRLAWRAISGGLGMGLRQLVRLAGNKLAYFASFGVARFRGTAQILSVAVDPGTRGMGVGTLLVEAALQVLRGRGVRFVKLEVRPDNAPARRLYERLGFVAQGSTEDSQGRWLVMLKDLAVRESTGSTVEG